MKPKMIYFCSEFPAISHTFISREIETIKESGTEILTAAVNYPLHFEKLSTSDKVHAAETVYLKKIPYVKIVRILFMLSIKKPLKTLRMAWGAVSLIIIKGPKSLRKALGYFLEAAILVDAAQKQNVQHIHVHFANPAATVALIASRSGVVEYSISVHGPDVFYNVDQNLLKEKLEAATFARCISHYCKSQLCRLIAFDNWSKLHIVRCGIDPAIFSPRPNPNNALPQLLCVGRLTRNKGQHVLIEACALLKKSGTPFHLILVGDGEDRAFLERRISALNLKNETTLTGAVGRDLVKQYYEKADIFILPSFAEGVPVVLMEAMAMAIPVVSTCITGIPELIETGVSGMLTIPGDVDMLAETIRMLLENPDLGKQLGQEARQKVADTYNLAKNCKELSALFESELE